MDISELKKKKRLAGLTNAQISERTGIPFSTVNKIFSGATQNPRYATVLAIESLFDQVLNQERSLSSGNEKAIGEKNLNCGYDAADWKALDPTRKEIIDGIPHMLPWPDRIHQRILHHISYEIERFIYVYGGECEVYSTPFYVKLFKERETYVLPDLCVICRPEILTAKGCIGAPDWIIEVVSEEDLQHDYITKVSLYQQAGVRMYWIIDQNTLSTMAYDFERQLPPVIYHWKKEPHIDNGLEFLQQCSSSILRNTKKKE